VRADLLGVAITRCSVTKFAALQLISLVRSGLRRPRGLFRFISLLPSMILQKPPNHAGLNSSPTLRVPTAAASLVAEIFAWGSRVVASSGMAARFGAAIYGEPCFIARIFER